MFCSIRLVLRSSPLVGVIVAVLSLGAGAAAGEGTSCDYDLFLLSGGVARDLTNTPFTCEFRPEWSPSRQQVVYNDGSGVGIFIADVSTGVGTLLPGSDNGNNPSWSPNGQLIAFDRHFADDPTLYVLPPGGGIPKAVAS